MCAKEEKSRRFSFAHRPETECDWLNLGREEGRQDGLDGGAFSELSREKEDGGFPRIR